MHILSEHDAKVIEVEGDETASLSFHKKLKLLHIDAPDEASHAVHARVRVNRHIKNANKEMHAINTDYHGACVICDERIRHPVSHYVRRHEEVYTSRITQSVADAYCAADPTSTMTADGSIAAMCPVCQSDRESSASSWLEHFTLHSGEYRYRCDRCKHKVSRLNSHAKSVCGGRTMEKKISINAEMDANGIYGYVCRLCNYIQLGRDRLVAHVQQQHGIEDEPGIVANFQRIMLVSTKVEWPTPPRNDNADVYCSNPSYRNLCMLCARKQSNIINHYVSCHPDAEVYHCRLSPAMASMCIGGLPEAYSVAGESKVEALCVFCERERMFERNRWMDHISTHIGEYRYECAHCKHRFSTPHAHSNSANCDATNPTINQVFQFELEDNYLFGYICKHCNFIQLSIDKITQHIVQQHDIDESAAVLHCDKVRILDLNAGGRVKDVPPNDNPDMYISNEKYKKRCAACGERSFRRTGIVSHYVRNHTLVRSLRISDFATDSGAAHGECTVHHHSGQRHASNILFVL